MNLQSPVTVLKGVGNVLAAKLASSFGIHNIADLLQNFPRRYNDYSAVVAIKDLQPGAVTIKAVVTQIKGRYVRRGLHITEAVVSDGSDSIRLVWFNQPYRENGTKLDQPYYISGQYELGRGRFAVMNPSMELVSDFPVNTARIVPIYRETKGLTSNQLRKMIRDALPALQDTTETIPSWVIEEHNLLAYKDSIKAIHFPESIQQLEVAKHRLGFEEVFSLSLASLLNKYELLKDTSVAVPFAEDVAKTFVTSLPFKLTDAQRKVTWQILQDMQKTQPMNRLVEGDVGSGKTVVATMAALMAAESDFQSVFMAPTELLARQHAETIYRLVTPLGKEHEVVLLVGGMTTAQKDAAKQAIAVGRAKFVIGTHALIQEGVDLQNLGLAIIDEQHRFGVGQRQKLMAKAGHMPHLLSLTATPIPRSLALTLYGELDISIIDAKPVGRLPIITEICSPHSRPTLYQKIDQQLALGKQMFVVCPLITESATKNSASAELTYERLSQHEFKHRKVGLLHGKMKAVEKQAVMQDFIDKKIDILVSTTVIEVGVDVPSATIMLIEDAESFGLAQLHQLRGRVGRNQDQGYCYLMMSDASQPPKRLQALERTNDGFKLAELDLSLRGPGAIYGSQQHGALDLRIAQLSDVKLIAAARNAAQHCIERNENLVQYPILLAHVKRLRAVTNLN